MAVDSFRLVVAMNLIEKEADSAAQRWDMLKLWLKKEEAAQQGVQSDGAGVCPLCGDKLFCAMCGEHVCL